MSQEIMKIENKQREKSENKNNNSKVSSSSMFLSKSSEKTRSKQADEIEQDPNAGLSKLTK